MTKYSSFFPVEIRGTGRYNIHKIKKINQLAIKSPYFGSNEGQSG